LISRKRRSWGKGEKENETNKYRDRIIKEKWYTVDAEMGLVKGKIRDKERARKTA